MNMPDDKKPVHEFDDDEEDPLDREDEEDQDQDSKSDSPEEDDDDQPTFKQNFPSHESHSDEDTFSKEEEQDSEEEEEYDTPKRTFTSSRMEDEPSEQHSFNSDNLASPQPSFRHNEPAQEPGEDESSDQPIRPHPTYQPPQSKENSLDDLAEEELPLHRTDYPSSHQEEEEYNNPNLHIPNLRSSQSQNQGFAGRRNMDQNFNNNNNNYQNSQYDQNNFGGRFQPERRGGASKMHLLILVLIGISVIGATVYLLKNQFGDLAPGGAQQTPMPSSTTVAEQTPLPTPTPQALNRADFKIRVLNGTSKTGLAGTVSNELKSLGYQIDKTGNATNSAFPQTVVRTKDNSALSQQLIVDLSPDYTAVASTPLKSSDSYDAEVILGAK